MINHFIFNRSLKKSILLIHGLHTNSGFWIPFLSEFKDFKIILLNIDYIPFVSQSFAIHNIQQYLHEFELLKNCVAIISHSLGTIISSQIGLPDNVTKHEICPVYSSIRINTTEYIRYIGSKLLKSRRDILADLLVVDKYLSIVRITSDVKVLRYFPINDIYFQFTLKIVSNVYFDGHHFFIDEAIKKIKGCLNKIEF